MYQPPHHVESDPKVLHALIRAHPLGLLVSSGADGPVANPLPFLLDADIGPHGRLRAHLAKANAQWRLIADNPEATVLVVFQGVDSYITPSWYETKRETGKVVPTWNYVAIHAYGPVEFFDDTERLRAIVTRLTERQESSRAAPWAVTDAPADFVEGMLKGIVGFAMPIARLEGKWKMSQNRPAHDRTGVVDGLADEGREDVAALIPR